MAFSSSNPEISIKSSFLTLDSTRLRADILDIPDSIERAISADYLETILHLGRESILRADLYRLWVVRLGNTEQTDGEDSSVRTIAGYNKENSILDSLDEVQAPFHGYWHAIEAAGFTPEVRITTTKNYEGSWMLLGQNTDET